MSREQYRARSKKVQKLGRDGLVEQDKATGQEERISKRTADISFGAESHEQDSGRTIPHDARARDGRRRPHQGAPAPKPAAALVPESKAPPSPAEKWPDSERPQFEPDKDTSILETGGAPEVGPSHRRLKQDEKAERSEYGQEKAQAKRPTKHRGRLQFEPDKDTPAPEADGAPEAGPSHRRQRQYEKAERRVEQSEHRLEKAQANLPTKRHVRLQQEYDANTGKARRRLRFESEAVPETAKPALPIRAGREVKTAAVWKLHGRLRETERDNVAMEAAHKGEFAAERGAGQLLRWNRSRLRSKPYRNVRRAEQRLATEKTRLAWQTALRDNPELRRKGVLAKWVQKQKLKRRYAQAVRAGQKRDQHIQQAEAVTARVAHSVTQAASAHKTMLLFIGLLVLVIGFFSAGLASCGAMVSSSETSYILAVYPADALEICKAALYFTELETDLKLEIQNTMADYPDYDQYRYNLEEIGHDPYELMSYLSAAYDMFTFEQVRPELDWLFSEMYQLTRTSVTETHYDSEGEPYDWYVLETTLTVRPLAEIIRSSLASGEQTERYEVYMQTHGGRQMFGSPFDFPWLDHVSSSYGWRVHPISGEKSLHRGVDIAAAQGTAIAAIHDGRVVSAGNAGSYGLCVVIEDDKGYQSRYAHCSSLSVSAGQEVKRGDVIGAVGSTGNSTGPHLHLEITLNGELLDPIYFVAGGAASGTPED